VCGCVCVCAVRTITRLYDTDPVTSPSESILASETVAFSWLHSLYDEYETQLFKVGSVHSNTLETLETYVYIVVLCVNVYVLCYVCLTLCRSYGAASHKDLSI